MWTRIYEKFLSVKETLGNGISALSFVAVMLAIFVPGVPEGTAKGILVAAFLVVSVLFILFKRADHVARPEARTVYYVSLPCTPADLDEAIKIAQHYFGKDSMKPDVVRAAYKVNPFSFIVIKDSSGVVLGYFDHFALKPECFDRFLSGELPENALSAADFVSGEEAVEAKRLYIGGIAIKSKSKFEAGKITKCLLWAGGELLNKRYLAADSQYSLYATGFSKSGVEMLKSLGFGKVAEGDKRVDNAPLYWRDVTRKAVGRYKQSSPICKSELIVKFERDPQAFTPTITHPRNSKSARARSARASR